MVVGHCKANERLSVRTMLMDKAWRIETWKQSHESQSIRFLFQPVLRRHYVNNSQVLHCAIPFSSCQFYQFPCSDVYTMLGQQTLQSHSVTTQHTIIGAKRRLSRLLRHNVQCCTVGNAPQRLLGDNIGEADSRFGPCSITPSIFNLQLDLSFKGV